MKRKWRRLVRQIEQLSDQRRQAQARAASYARALAVGQQRQWAQLTPTEFELYVASLFQRYGCAVVHTGQTADGGIDLTVEKNGRRGLVQCKRYTRPVGAAEVREFRGALAREQVTLGFFVTTSGFTKNAITEAAYPPKIILYDGVKLAQLAEELDPATAALQQNGVAMGKRQGYDVQVGRNPIEAFFTSCLGMFGAFTGMFAAYAVVVVVLVALLLCCCVLVLLSLPPPPAG